MFSLHDLILHITSHKTVKTLNIPQKCQNVTIIFLSASDINLKTHHHYHNAAFPGITRGSTPASTCSQIPHRACGVCSPHFLLSSSLFLVNTSLSLIHFMERLRFKYKKKQQLRTSTGTLEGGTGVYWGM